MTPANNYDAMQREEAASTRRPDTAAVGCYVFFSSCAFDFGICFACLRFLLVLGDDIFQGCILFLCGLQLEPVMSALPGAHFLSHAWLSRHFFPFMFCHSVVLSISSHNMILGYYDLTNIVLYCKNNYFSGQTN